MIREVIATGRDVNTAIDNGCTELGIDRDIAQFEIISLPKKGFLGLKVYPAKVKVFEELPDLPKPPAPRPAPAQRPAPPPPPPRAKQPDATAAAPAAVAAAHGAPPRPAADRAPRPAPPHHTPAPPRVQQDNEEFGETIPQTEIVPTPEVREKVEGAAVYLAEIMRAMGFETIEVTPAYYSENVCLRLSGAQLGVVIGRRGETLDALQYLTSLVANRGEGDYIRVNIDSGNYREKREKTLNALARKLALQAVRTGKSTTLEPMNPYERRVIHGAVSQIRGAVSTSIGADPNRRVVISVADPTKRTGEATIERSRSGDRGGRGRPGEQRDHGRTGDNKLPAGPRTPLRPNTNTAESVAAAKSAPAATAVPIDHESDGPTATFVATRETPMAPPPPPPHAAPTPPHFAPAAPVPQSTPAAPARKLSDVELYGDIPMGVPIVSGDHPAAPRVQEHKPEVKHEPKKIEGTLYGKIE